MTSCTSFEPITILFVYPWLYTHATLHVTCLSKHQMSFQTFWQYVKNVYAMYTVYLFILPMRYLMFTVPPPLPPRLVLVPPVPQTQPVVNSGDSDADGEPWSCSACTFLNYPALTKCEVCEMPRMSALSPVASPRGEGSQSLALTAHHVHSDQCYCHH